VFLLTARGAKIEKKRCSKCGKTKPYSAFYLGGKTCSDCSKRKNPSRLVVGNFYLER
jgi:hypothetical protein